MPATKWLEIAETVHRSILSGNLRPGEALPSEEQLAIRWNVCRSTAHRAMNELKRKGVVVRKRRHGTVVADRQNNLVKKIALLSVASGDFLLVEYIRGIRSALPDDYEFTYFDSHFDAEREADYLRNMVKDTSGIICFPTAATENTQLLRDIAARLPLVCIDRLPDGLDVSAVVSDNHEATYRALKMLTSRGHRHIGFLGQDCPWISTIRERIDAYRKVMLESGVENAERYERLILLGSDFEKFAIAVQDALFMLLHLKDPITAIFCQNEIYMTAVLEARRNLGTAVPKNFEIISFCDMPPIMLYLAGGVHRIVQRSYEAGRAAAKQVLSQINRTQATQVLRIPSRLCEAGSTTKLTNIEFMEDGPIDQSLVSA